MYFSFSAASFFFGSRARSFPSPFLPLVGFPVLGLAPFLASATRMSCWDRAMASSPLIQRQWPSYCTSAVPLAVTSFTCCWAGALAFCPAQMLLMTFTVSFRASVFCDPSWFLNFTAALRVRTVASSRFAASLRIVARVACESEMLSSFLWSVSQALLHLSVKSE